jgi:hypothetical protein
VPGIRTQHGRYRWRYRVIAGRYCWALSLGVVAHYQPEHYSRNGLVEGIICVGKSASDP